MEKTRNVHRVWLGNFKERDKLQDLGVGGSLKEQDGMSWVGLIWPRREKCRALVNTVTNFRDS